VSFLDFYRQHVADGLLHPDEEQAALVPVLQKAYDYVNQSLLKKWFFTKKMPFAGIYLYGDVGRGKTALMTLLCQSLSSDTFLRYHFYDLMSDLYTTLHKRRLQADRLDLLQETLLSIVGDKKLLCLDEFFVRDVADAMLLKDVISFLFSRGVLVFMTSNCTVDNLYKDGLQRERFLPCIHFLKERFVVACLAGSKDYRLQSFSRRDGYLYPFNNVNTGKLNRWFQELVPYIEPQSINVKGRPFNVCRANNHVAWFEYNDLFVRHLGPEDFRCLTDYFKGFFLTGLRPFDNAAECRRFIQFIDCLYDRNGAFFCVADCPPEKLCSIEDEPDFKRTLSRIKALRHKI
jgi:cell division protein ZapE